ncbi:MULTISPECIES: hypothetical protein [Rhizobium]|uniref:hypothetical protein n=1 Tax=Rhizobium TaxID=379 RepID=UPI002852E76C|nr:hypothetical protein [Rhizobium favelukesii]
MTQSWSHCSVTRKVLCGELALINRWAGLTGDGQDDVTIKIFGLIAMNDQREAIEIILSTAVSPIDLDRIVFRDFARRGIPQPYDHRLDKG